MGGTTKIKFTDFERNLLINGMNEFCNMLLAENLPIKDVGKLLSQNFVQKNFHLPIDKVGGSKYNVVNSIFQTVEAEITAMMPLQRACGAESQVRNKLSNGPLRAQSNVIFTKYSATLQADVICREYVGILLSAQGNL